METVSKDIFSIVTFFSQNLNSSKLQSFYKVLVLCSLCKMCDKSVEKYNIKIDGRNVVSYLTEGTSQPNVM